MDNWKLLVPSSNSALDLVRIDRNVFVISVIVNIYSALVSMKQQNKQNNMNSTSYVLVLYLYIRCIS